MRTQKEYIKEYGYVVVLIIIFCLTVSVITFDPNDPSTFHRLSNSPQKISNYFGPFGASFADWSFQILGVGAIVFLVIFFAQLLHTFRRPLTRNNLYLKIFGYPQLILFYLGFSSGIKPFTNFKGIQIFTGGILGNKVFELSSQCFGTRGALVILFLGGLSSLTLCLGIKPLSSIVWFFQLIPFKRAKNFAQQIAIDPNPNSVLEFEQELWTENVQSSLSNRQDQNVFLDLISTLNSSESASVKNILQSEEFQNMMGGLPIILGQKNDGYPVVMDLRTLPNLFIEIPTLADKNQSVNILILSLILNKSPSELKIFLIDLQMLEFAYYEGIDHLLTSVITSPHRCILAFEWLVDEMEKRQSLLKQHKSRNFNDLKNDENLPYLVVIVNELWDLMMSIPYELEGHLEKLSHRAHLVGIHLIFATQKPTLQTTTTTIQSNFINRLQFNETINSFTSEDSGVSIELQKVGLSSQEIHALGNKLRHLYPFKTENSIIK